MFVLYGTNMLFNTGGSIDATFNKAAAGNNASFSFKTGFSARALLGLLGSDHFTIKISANGLLYWGASSGSVVVRRLGGVAVGRSAPGVAESRVVTVADRCPDRADLAEIGAAVRDVAQRPSSELVVQIVL